MPRIARVLLQQTHQNQGPSFSNINLTSKTYNGEWAFVGESVQQPGQFALGEFRHPALREYHPLLAEAVRATGMTWKKDPSQWPCYRITFANNQQRSGAVRTVPAQAARRQTARRLMRIQTGRNVHPNAMSDIAPNGVEKTHGDNRRHPLLYGCIGNAIIAQVGYPAIL